MACVAPARAAQVEERPTATAAISNSRCAASTKRTSSWHGHPRNHTSTTLRRKLRNRLRRHDRRHRPQPSVRHADHCDGV
ncbi:hypothetical protein GA590_08050 [Bifidobacterium adolescentis]|nr:hypothetical protein GA590_08050 [Bifidobacterium adolescentis]